MEDTIFLLSSGLVAASRHRCTAQFPNLAKAKSMPIKQRQIVTYGPSFQTLEHKWHQQFSLSLRHQPPLTFAARKWKLADRMT